MAFEKKVSIAIIGKTDQFVKSLNKGQGALKSFGTVAGNIGKVAAAGIAGLSVAAVTVGKDMVELASNAKEAESAFEATFGEAIPEFGTFIEDFSKKAGLATFELKDLLKTSGSVLQGIDMSAEASANLSKELAIVAGDVAAFNNVQGGTQPVLETFTKALLGERESLKTYGIAISEAEVQTKAFEMTGKSSAKELTRQEKALATYELLVKKSTTSQGYLNAEQDTFATKSKQAQAKIKELQATLGAELLPIVEQLLPVIIDMVQEVGPHLTEAIKTVAPFIASIGQLFSDLAPPIIAIVSLLLKLLAPAFRKMTEIVQKYVAPFLTNLPQNFENMVNRIIRALNKFIDKINGFASKAKNLLSKIGIDVGFGEIGRLAEVKFAQAAEVKSIVGTTAVSPEETIQDLSKSALASAKSISGAFAPNTTINFNKEVSDPNEVINAINKYVKANGPLNRTLDII